MKVTRTVEEFIKHNDADLRRFIAFAAKSMDEDLIQDCTQSFYLAAIKGRLFENFDPGNADPEKAFRSWVCSSARNMVITYWRSAGRGVNRSTFTTVETAGETQDVLEAIAFAKGTECVAGMGVATSCEYAALGGGLEEKTLAVINSFKEELSEDESLSEATRTLCVSYLNLALVGYTPYEVAQVHGVSPAYISYLRKMLRLRFREVREALSLVDVGVSF